jgi:hypothetical protein
MARNKKRSYWMKYIQDKLSLIRALRQIYQSLLKEGVMERRKKNQAWGFS